MFVTWCELSCLYVYCVYIVGFLFLWIWWLNCLELLLWVYLTVDLGLFVDVVVLFNVDLWFTGYCIIFVVDFLIRCLMFGFV